MSEEPIPSHRLSSAVRASDQDRERLVDELNEHTVAGRLSTDELEERLQSVYAARTTAELETLRRDLPRTDRQLAIDHAARRSHLLRRTIQETGGSLSLFVVCTAIWLFSGHDGHHGQFWPVWLLIIVVMSLARNGWALFGPAPDLDAAEARLDARRDKQLEHRDRRRGS
ncbi:MAG: DUF1707 domain-containing protein [Solirubrobacteraceae bacterium]